MTRAEPGGRAIVLLFLVLFSDTSYPEPAPESSWVVPLSHSLPFRLLRHSKCTDGARDNAESYMLTTEISVVLGRELGGLLLFFLL